MEGILINRKDLDFLKNLSAELKTQNSRCTAYPIWRILRVKKEIGFREEYADGVCLINTETQEMYDRDMIIDCILKNAVNINNEKYDSIEEFLDDRGYSHDVSYEELIEIVVTEMNIECLIKEWYKEVHELEGFFLTESSINEYIELNKHKLMFELGLNVYHIQPF